MLSNSLVILANHVRKEGFRMTNFTLLQVKSYTYCEQAVVLLATEDWFELRNFLVLLALF